jgi:hypothetical protein
MTNVISLTSRKRPGCTPVRTEVNFDADGRWATVRNIDPVNGVFVFRVPRYEAVAFQDALAANVGNEPAIIVAFVTAWIDAGWRV